MNVLGTLFRLICSWVILLTLAVYLQTPAHISPGHFIENFNAETLLPLVSTVNWFTITAAALLVLAVLRIQELSWNVAYAAATILFLGLGLCSILDPGIALPAAIESNRAVLDFCNLPQSYPIPSIIIIAIFAMGWLCSTAPFRIMFTCVLSVALWYGCSEVFSYMVGMWAKSPNPTMPELLHAIQSAPWIIAAIPGAFFLVYALLTAFIETFISRREEDRRIRAEKKETEQSAAEELAETPVAPVEQAKPTTPKLKVKKAAPKAEEKPAEDAASKAEEKPVEEATPKTEEKPAEEAAPKAEEKPAEEATPKAEEEPAEETAPKAEEKPAEEADPKAEEKPAEETAPKAEEKPAEETAPKAEEKPADETAPKAEEKPAEETAPKAEEKPAAEAAPKAEEKPAAEAAPKAEETDK